MSNYGQITKGFVPIKNFEGLYAINRQGQVYSYPRQGSSGQGMILKSIQGKHGYPYVTLCKDGKRNPHLLHRLLAEAFLPNPLNKREVNHINGIKTDFRLKNLEWMTPSENCQHAIDTGLHVSLYGEKVHTAKLTDELVVEMRQKYKTGLYSTRQLAAEYPIKPSNIWKALKGISWSHI